MATYLVNYDLRKPGRNYDDLLKRLREYPSWCRFLESSWFVVANDVSTSGVRDELAKYIDSGDGLLVMDASHDSAAWLGLSSTISDWVKQNL